MNLPALLLILAVVAFGAAAPNRKPRIFCLIHTTNSAHSTRLAAILDTWAPKCDGKLIFTDAPLSPEIPHVYFPMMGTRDHSWEKIRRVFRYVHETMMTDGEGEYDWYLRADDDAYVLMDNARELSAKFDPTQPLVLGFRWGFIEPKGYVDGGVYIVSREGVKTFNNLMMNDSLCPDEHLAEEDQQLSRCMAKAGVFPVDTRDSAGRERFHHFHVDEMKSKWMVEFIKQNSYYTFLGFPDQISDTTVSLHHVSPFEMRLTHYLINRLRYDAAKKTQQF